MRNTQGGKERRFFFLAFPATEYALKTFRLLTLKPSSLLKKLDVVTRDLNTLTQTLRGFDPRDCKEWFHIEAFMKLLNTDEFH